MLSARRVRSALLSSVAASVFVLFVIRQFDVRRALGVAQTRCLDTLGTRKPTPFMNAASIFAVDVLAWLAVAQRLVRYIIQGLATAFMGRKSMHAIDGPD